MQPRRKQLLTGRGGRICTQKETTMRLRTIATAAAFTLAAASIAAGDQAAGQSIVAKLAWRSVGPFIGGRVVAVAGVPGQANLFYMGAVDGGVWKSTDYGIKWVNISDGTLPGESDSIGAIAVAPSNPNVIWAGTGESDIRGDMITGDGVFKSTDEGKTWAYAGLRDTRTTSAIAIDPRNAGVVYVASMGHAFAPNGDRGVFKTTDGGKTWTKVLFVNDATGAIALSMDPQHPATLYAAMWQAQRQPWKLTSGGPGSGLYKTTDGGAHWTNLSRNPGYPGGVLGRIGVGVSASDPRVVYSIVQAKAGGIFRSDDGGGDLATYQRRHGVAPARLLLYVRLRRSDKPRRDLRAQRASGLGIARRRQERFARCVRRTATTISSGSIRATRKSCSKVTTAAPRFRPMVARPGAASTISRRASSITSRSTSGSRFTLWRSAGRRLDRRTEASVSGAHLR